MKPPLGREPAAGRRGQPPAAAGVSLPGLTRPDRWVRAESSTFDRVNESVHRPTPAEVTAAGLGLLPDVDKVVNRFGLQLDRAAFDRLGRALDRITEAERVAFAASHQTRLH